MSRHPNGAMEPGDGPARVMVLSASVGEGHDAAAAVLADMLAEAWPGCDVQRVDVADMPGRWFGRLLRWSYQMQVNVLPPTYELPYQALCRSYHAARSAKRLTSWFFGRAIERAIDGQPIDLAVSTYPFASGGLDWLRRKLKLACPTATYVADFHVHPMWAYEHIDAHFVMYPGAARHARTPGVERTLRLAAPPIRGGFGRLSRGEARIELGLDAEAFTVLVCGGAWGLGPMAEAALALTRLDPPPQVIAVCGHNRDMQANLRAAGLPADRLLVLGYVDAIPSLMAAADVVVTNGAGLTVLEALESSRPVIAFRPLAGHGRAAAKVLGELGLAMVTADVDELVEAAGRLASDPLLLLDMEARSREFLQDRNLRGSVAELCALVGSQGRLGPVRL